MKIEYFRELMILVETGNYLTASEVLHVSQSSLSRHIMSVEEYFGAEIINRASKRFTVTEKGKYILEYAAQIAELYDSLFDTKERNTSGLSEPKQKHTSGGENSVI